jgi:hypothetical protein
LEAIGAPMRAATGDTVDRTPAIRRWEMARETSSGAAATTKSTRSTAGASTAADTVEAIREWAARHGRVPAEQDWEQAGGGHPSAAVVTRQFGSWKGGLAAAGFVLEPGHRPGVQS